MLNPRFFPDEDGVMNRSAVGAMVATGRFGAEMQVRSVNEGPVTLLVEV